MNIFIAVVFWGLGLAIAATISTHLAVRITSKEHDKAWKDHCERVNDDTNGKTYTELLPIHRKEEAKISRKTFIIGCIAFSLFVSGFYAIHCQSVDAIDEYETALIKSQEHKS